MGLSVKERRALIVTLREEIRLTRQDIVKVVEESNRLRRELADLEVRVRQRILSDLVKFDRL